MIIGICGLIGSGKGSVGDILVEQGYTKVSFADKLKDGVATIFGYDRSMLEGDTDESRSWREQTDEFWSKETGRTITPRIVLQEFGTDCMRNGYYDGVWVSLLKQQILDNPGDYVIPDVRFRNEQDMIRELSGQIWRVQRGDVPEWYGCAMLDNTTGGNLMEAYDIHSSEYKWIDLNNKFDTTIYNNNTLDQLKQLVLNEISNPPR
jgi:hypothetical protein|tara:strand:+ start:84 stop:701 length:618 start_codon:yes stop_codon:yes gene_type:complete